jgi:hypothetical protein
LVNRESAKFFQDQVTKVDKYKNLVAKKRQRSSADITGGSNYSKIGGSHSNSPINQVLPGEHLGQRQDDRPKNLVPNKRARSSLGETRVCIFFSVLVISFLAFVVLLVLEVLCFNDLLSE